MNALWEYKQLGSNFVIYAGRVALMSVQTEQIARTMCDWKNDVTTGWCGYRLTSAGRDIVKQIAA